VPVEDVSSDLHLALVEVDDVAVFAGQAVSAFIADPVPDVVADDRTCRRDREDDPGRQSVSMSRIRARDDERGLAGKRYAQLSAATRTKTAR
jgi:hypothetical protein